MSPKVLDDLIAHYRLSSPLYVTRPTLPSLDEYAGLLEGVWERQWLTNEGELHQRLERELCEFLGVEHLNLFCNGTIALLVALQALGIDEGEVITTPFTFPATVHVLDWNRLVPVFCDIDPVTFNLYVDRIEESITPNTRAILGVHVYGNPCDVERIQEIADRHGLYVIYDAAHAFGVQYKGRPILQYGDMSMVSFHATKLFTTGEGGALAPKSAEHYARVNLLKNFGIAGEESVIGPGINGKMNEFQAALGLLCLKSVDEEIVRRREVARMYGEGLKNVSGVEIPCVSPDVERNCAYFPVLIHEREYGMDRDGLYSLLKRFNVYARKYFYPLCSRYTSYRNLPSASPDRLPVGERVAKEVLCLPIYGKMEKHEAATVIELVRQLPQVVGGSSMCGGKAATADT